jgi:uncharacterized protein YcbX
MTTFGSMIVESLFEYPVKGLRGLKVPCATVNPRGLNNDRRWMIVDSANSFISQRQFPILTQFKPVVEDGLKITKVDSELSASIPFSDFTSVVEVEVWGQIVKAHASNADIDNWLSTQIGQQVKLVYMDDEDTRVITSSKDGAIVSFADGYPVLLTGSASLQDLNDRLHTKASIDRFRPNIHVSTTTAFEEEEWQRIKIGEVYFQVAKKCARCPVINIEQDSGRSTKETLKTLSSYRKEGNKVNFGINLIPENTGIIHESDPVEVIL